MSSLIVEICTIDKISEHPTADLLDLSQVKGWQVCVPKGRYSEGSEVVYIPIDSIIPLELSDKLGITKYLQNGRVRCAKLRGEPSFGVIMDKENPDWKLGQDVAGHYNVTKYEPPIKITAGDAEIPHGLFESYSQIENLRNFPGVFEEGEHVIISEKLHGTSSRVGIVEDTLMIGSMAVRRKLPENYNTSLYAHPLLIKGVIELLKELSKSHQQVILYGELYGSKIQSLDYGHIKGSVGYSAFDLKVDGVYLDSDMFLGLMLEYEIPVVPILYRGPYYSVIPKELSQGSTTLGSTDHIKEGVVVGSTKERLDPKIGRCKLKYLSNDYLFSKCITDSKDV